jgi:hypothetical protein
MPMNYKPGPMPAPGFGQQMPKPPMPKPMPPQQPMYGQPMPFQGNALMPGVNYQPGPMQPRFPNALAMWGRR